GKDVSLSDDEICFCGITGSALDIYNHAPSRYSWIPKRNVKNLAGLRGEGAGQIRSNGRFLVRYNADPLSKAVSGKVAHIARPLPFNNRFDYDKNTEGMEYPTIVNIVGSVAGGTGSGTIIDMIVLAAETLKSSGASFKIQPWIVLPEVFRTMVPGPPSANVYQNAYGALRELDYLYHLAKNNTNPLDFGFTQVKYLAEEVDDAYLLNNSTKAGIVLQHIDDVTDSIGRCMFLPSNEVSSVTDNVKQVRFVYSVGNKEAHYKSAGSSELIYDNQAVGNVLARAIISDICDELCNVNSVNAANDAHSWMEHVRIQEHDADLLTDDLLAKPAPFMVAIGKDTSVDDINANIFGGAAEKNVLDEVSHNYQKKLDAVRSELKTKVDTVLNQQCGVGEAISFIGALIDGINLSLGEMQEEKAALSAALAYTVDWSGKLNAIKPKRFWESWSDDDGVALAQEVAYHIEQKRDLLRHTYAIQFYNQLLQDVNVYQQKVTLLKTNIKAVREQQLNEMAAIQRNAATCSKFQLYLHLDDVNNFARPAVADSSAQFRSATPINTLLGAGAPTIENKLWAFAEKHAKVKDAVNVTIEQKLASLSDVELQKCFIKMKEMSSPLWTTNTRGYCDYAQPLTTVFTIGCYDAQNGIIQDKYSNIFTVGNNKPTFAATRQTDRIVFFQTENYSPVYAVNNLPGYMQDADRKLNVERHYPVCYMDEKWFQRMEVEKFDVFPQAETDTVLPNWVNGIVYGYIKYDLDNQTYYMLSEQGDILRGGYLALGQRRDIAFDAFQTRGLDKEIEAKVLREIDQKGRPQVLSIIKAVKDDIINYVDKYAGLSPVELDRVKVKDQAYKMVIDKLEEEAKYITNLEL
ncbi:MAG: hypothetical protein HUJ98_08730, partial [Bacteroidaceae bacterium]|nr:hypothetical protein [Bacteroidaceae bacterium]